MYNYNLNLSWRNFEPPRYKFKQLTYMHVLAIFLVALLVAVLSDK